MLPTIVIAAVLGVAAACVLSSAFRISSPAAIRAALDDPLLHERAAEHVERVATADLLAGRLGGDGYRYTVQELARSIEQPAPADVTRR
jgi:hypothetical protein